MYCIKCGKQIPDGQVACNECTLELLQKEFQTPMADEAPVAEEPIVEEAPIIEEAPNVEAPLNYTEPVVNINEEPVSAPNIPYQPVNAYIPTPKPKAPKSPCSAKSTVAFILSCVSLYLVLQAYSFPLDLAIMVFTILIAPAIISIIFGAKSLSGCKVYTAIGVLKDTRTFVFGLIGMIQGIVSAFLISLGFLLYSI